MSTRRADPATIDSFALDDSAPAQASVKPVGIVDRSEIIRALRTILTPGQVTELRALEAITADDRRPHTFGGYFDDPLKLAAATMQIKKAKGIYFVLNPIKPSLLARSVNKARAVGKGEITSDHDIERRCWLPIDCDARRPAGIPASDEEHQAAIDKACLIRTTLSAEGWPDPILADSGNGAHLLYRVDLPTDDGGMVQRCLESLAKRFDDDTVQIDRVVFNPARIWKLYGTLAAKGDSDAAAMGRPHRMSGIIDLPTDGAARG